MTNEEPGPAPDHALGVAVRVLLSPDGKRVAVDISPHPLAGDLKADRRLVIGVDPDASHADIAAMADDEVRDWHPMIDLDELRGHIEHWRVTGPGRRGECGRHGDGADGCCFPEALATVASDLDDHAVMVRERLWRE